VVETPNLIAIGNTLFTTPEDLSSPRVATLLAAYPLAEVVQKETDEFRRARLLRNWIFNRVRIDRNKPAAGGDDALALLEKCPAGGAYHCGHYMQMQQAVLNAMGHVTRPMFAGAGAEEGPLSGSHGMNEVWINDLQKWVLFDAEFDAHYEKSGLPLSAVEIRNEMWKDEGNEVVKVTGPDREPVERERPDSYGVTPYTFKWVSWYPEANLFTRWPEKRSSKEIVFVDDIWHQNIWYRNSRKHYAYDADMFVKATDLDAIYWTPNTIRADITIKGTEASVVITSETPNLREY